MNANQLLNRDGHPPSLEGGLCVSVDSLIGTVA